ncbi:MAG TPA: long-chain fatty acid--CoA ligase [Thermoanaerobaculaceae bacterium]|nr:long-chain fatty acid--CoA ligase [Thermoanaerobaculaceae bacterium]
MADPKTLVDIFALWCSSTPAAELIDARHHGEVRIKAPEILRRVAGLARGLAALGVGPGDRVALLCGNRPEWHVTDFAVQHLGAILVPIYPTLLGPQVRAVLADSGAKVGVAENAEQLAKLAEAQSACPALRQLVVIDGEAPAGAAAWSACIEPMDAGGASAALAEMRGRVQPGDLATLIYTSGTTGEPKGVMLTHDNLVSNALSSSQLMPWPQGEMALAFLPLSHVLERLVDYIYFMRGVTIAYCGILESADTMRRLRPDAFVAVPRFFEKVHDRVMHEVAHAPRLKRAIFHAALRYGVAGVQRGRRGLAHPLYDALVYAKVRQALGGRVRFSISGGAPLPVFIAEFFHAIGLKVLEGYGLTETSPVIAVNRYDEFKLGTVGPPIPGVEVRIAADGEVLTRGPHVMKGYWNKPEATAAVLDAQGWFATGDIGELDADGFLRITDRKKDILVTAGGKNIAPQPIEEQLKKSPLVENAVLFGDRKPYVVALLVPSHEALEHWVESRGLPASDLPGMIARPEVAEAYQEVVDEVNRDLARYETIKRFRLVAEPFSIAGGELTPTLKVKRRVVEKRYEAVLAQLYAGGESGKTVA